LVKDTICKFDSLHATGHLFLTNSGSGQADSPLAQNNRLAVARLRLGIWKKSNASGLNGKGQLAAYAWS
jgi:hypothetical protein